MVVVYDWPRSIIPSGQAFRVPGQAVDGGFTTGGARTFSPEPGGRALLEWTFNYQGKVAAPRLFSWLMSKVSNGSIFRLRLLPSAQLISGSELGVEVPAGYEEDGVPWDGDLYWDNDLGWEFEVGAAATAIALEGSTTIAIDMTGMALDLGHGHAIGFGGSAYIVDDIEYSGSIATITVTPPVRKAVAVGDFVTFSPDFYGVCMDPETFKSLFDPSGIIRPGSIKFAEAILP